MLNSALESLELKTPVKEFQADEYTYRYLSYNLTEVPNPLAPFAVPTVPHIPDRP